MYIMYNCTASKYRTWKTAIMDHSFFLGKHKWQYAYNKHQTEDWNWSIRIFSSPSIYGNGTTVLGSGTKFKNTQQCSFKQWFTQYKLTNYLGKGHWITPGFRVYKWTTLYLSTYVTLSKNWPNEGSWCIED